MAETVLPGIGLTQSQWETYKGALYNKEADPVKGWRSIGGDGNAYIGGFQSGAAALETAGYLRRGSSDSNPYAWKTDNNWLKPNGEPITPGIRNYQDFLNSPAAQQDALLKYTTVNARTLENYKIINSNTPAPQRAGELAASHLIGATGRRNKGLDGTDANGMKARTYYEEIGKAVGGGQTVPLPPPNAAGSQATSGSAAGGQTSGPATGLSLAGLGGSAVNTSEAIEGVTSVTVASSADSRPGEYVQLPIPNPLEKYQTYNYLFTFSCLEMEAVNFPTTSYLRGDPGRIIFSSAGRYSENRVSTAYQNPDNPAGKYEYFIEEVTMRHTLVPNKESGGTNVMVINFEVIEPYSVGQFLQACQIAAFANKHYSYTEAPFLLTLEFKGYIDNKAETVPNTRRFFPVKFRSVKMTMSESGSKYQVSMIAWTDQSFDDEFNILKQDSTISGKTVVEMLQSGERSLQKVVNERLKEIATTNKARQYVPDEIAIVFPIPGRELEAVPGTTEDSAFSSSAVGESNGGSSIESKIKLNRNEKTKLLVQAAGDVGEIGNASFSFDATRGGTVPKQPDTPIVIKGIPNKKFARNSFNNDYTQREFTFRKGTTIVNAISEVLLMSDYCTDIVNGTTDNLGMYKWFRIESQVYMLTPNENNKAVGIMPKLLVFRVVNYKVHMSRFSSPDATPKGYEQLAQETVKEYNYIYTGKNTDVIDFNLDLNVNFGTNFLADGLGQYSGSALLSKLGVSGAGPEATDPYIPDPQPAASGEGGGDQGTGVARQRALPDRWKTSDGAGPADNYKTLVARVFQDKILNSEAEKTSAKLTILGDPYYIVDSGLGNYTNTKSTSRINLTETGQVDYQSNEVDIMFNFLTPVDLLSSGRLFFEGDYDTRLKVPFSGLYFVRTITSIFSKGKFTQELLLGRRPNQNTKDTLSEELSKNDSDGNVGSKKEGGAVESVDAEAPAVAAYDAGTENEKPSYASGKVEYDGYQGE